KRVIRCKIVGEGWMKDNGLYNVMDLIKRQRWENLFKRRHFVHIDVLASILSILGNNGICEYIKDVWEESKYTKPLQITRKFANDETLMAGRRVKSGEMKPFQRRRDDEMAAPAEDVHDEEVEDQNDFDWEAIIDEAAVPEESGSGEKFYDAKDEIQEPATVVEEVPVVVAQASVQQKETAPSGVDPSGPSGHLPETVMNKLQAEFERAR
ncbi:hypothetical protein Dimus_031747, partial [Dionaea muscipula]